MIAKRHISHGETNSKARANLAMRLLRAIFNFVTILYLKRCNPGKGKERIEIYLNSNIS